jgi:hypothetical protein
VHRIDKPGAIAGKFTMGNPQEGQRATQMGEDWPNAVQEELAGVIEGAGIELDKANNGQLLAAITAIINANVTEDGGEEGSVPITREVTGTGLVTGGHSLATDVELNVAAATGPEIKTGTEAAKAITPAGLLAAAGAVFGSAGYIWLPGGLIFQWGTGTAGANGTTIITLPTSFPNLCLYAGCEGGSGDTSSSHNGPYVSGRGTTSISIFNALDSASAITFFAFGH